MGVDHTIERVAIDNCLGCPAIARAHQWSRSSWLTRRGVATVAASPHAPLQREFKYHPFALTSLPSFLSIANDKLISTQRIHLVLEQAVEAESTHELLVAEAHRRGRANLMHQFVE